MENYKSRLVEKGYSQGEGISFGEIFSLVAKLNSIIFLLVIAAAFYLEVEKMDVKAMLLHGYIKEINE